MATSPPAQPYKKRGHDQFGEPLLALPELVPRAAGERQAPPQILPFLWWASLVSPAVYGFATAALPLPQAIVALLAAAALAVGLGSVAARAAFRRGVGSVPILRAAFGPRGAKLGLGLRVLAGAGLGALWLGELGRWTAVFVRAVTESSATAVKLPGARGPALIACVVIVVGAAGAWVVARRGLGFIRRCTLWSAVAMVLLAVALLILGGIASKGFGGFVSRRGPWDLWPMLRAVLFGVACFLPAVLGAADWLQGARPDVELSVGRRWLRRTAGLMAAVALVPVAWLGLVLGSASMAVRGGLDAHVIPDATGFGGVAGGLLAFGFAAALWVASAPLVAAYGPGMALLGIVPKLKRASRGAAAAAVLMALGAVGLAYLPWPVSPADLGLLVAPLCGLLLVDEWLVRRGKLLLEELYLKKSLYGPLLGVGVAACLAALVSLVTDPRLWPLVGRVWPGRPFLLERVALTVHGKGLTLPLLLVLGAVIFGLLRPLELGLARIFKLAAAESGAPKKPKKPPSKYKRLEDATTDGLTNPHFVYEPKPAPLADSSDAAGVKPDGEKPPS